MFLVSVDGGPMEVLLQPFIYLGVERVMGLVNQWIDCMIVNAIMVLVSKPLLRYVVYAP